eukprot:14714891-Heterocapsa_arctica.AAC.1
MRAKAVEQRTLAEGWARVEPQQRIRHGRQHKQYQQQTGWNPNQGGQGFNYGPAQQQQFWGPGAAQWGPPPQGSWYINIIKY